MEKYGSPGADSKGTSKAKHAPTNAGRGRGVVKANATTSNAQPTPPIGTDTQPLLGFTAEQWQSLVQAFGTPPLPSNRLNGEWIIDTGCSHHVTGNLSCLTNIKEVPPFPIGLPDGKNIVAVKEGDAKLTNNITLTNVLFVPKLHCNLISVSQLSDDLNCCVITNSSQCTIQDLHTREVIGTGDRRDGLYFLREDTMVQVVSAVLVNNSSSLELWHSRLGHPSEKVVKWLPFFNNTPCSLPKDCEVCYRAKQPRSSFPLSENKTTRIFELVHCDLWGPYDKLSSCGARYFLTIVDDFSRAVWVYLLIDKKEVFRIFMSFIAMIDRQFGHKLKIVRSDHGTEFNCLKD